MIHRFPVRVYYEDTDLAGIVYYANYLKFIERGRSEWLASLGIDQMVIKAETGVVFAVRRVEADYLSPARFGEDLTIETELTALTGARITLAQRVSRAGTPLFQAVITLAALTEEGRPARMPAQLKSALSGS